jgi:hypothetical protein
VLDVFFGRRGYMYPCNRCLCSFPVSENHPFHGGGGEGGALRSYIGELTQPSYTSIDDILFTVTIFFFFFGSAEEVGEGWTGFYQSVSLTRPR